MTAQEQSPAKPKLALTPEMAAVIRAKAGGLITKANKK